MTTTTLAAGPALDHVVATRVLGMMYSPRFPGAAEGYYLVPGQSHGFCGVPHYSTDLGAAAPVLDWLGARGHVVLAGDAGTWDCQLDLGRAFIVEKGATPAEAICRLALAVKEDAG